MTCSWIPLYLQLSRAAAHRIQVSRPNHRQNHATDLWLSDEASISGGFTLPLHHRGVGGVGHRGSVLAPASSSASSWLQRCLCRASCPLWLSEQLPHLAAGVWIASEKCRQAGSKQRASGIVQRCSWEGTTAQLDGGLLGSAMGSGGAELSLSALLLPPSPPTQRPPSRCRLTESGCQGKVARKIQEFEFQINNK